MAYGLTAPVRTPPAIVARLRSAIDDVMKDKAFTGRFAEMGFELDPLIGDAYRDFIVKDLEQWRGVAKAAGIRIGQIFPRTSNKIETRMAQPGQTGQTVRGFRIIAPSSFGAR